jgi:hypothetical protein
MLKKYIKKKTINVDSKLGWPTQETIHHVAMTTSFKIQVNDDLLLLLYCFFNLSFKAMKRKHQYNFTFLLG